MSRPAGDDQAPEGAIRPPQPDEIEMSFELLPRDGPTWAALFFWHAVKSDPTDPVVEPLLDRYCTPEFRAQLDVDAVRELLTGTSVTNIPRYPGSGMAYVLFVLNQPESLIVEAGHPTPIKAYYVTLLYWPELSGWRVHGVGDPILPEQLAV